jgi:hypothetical protein
MRIVALALLAFTCGCSSPTASSPKAAANPCGLVALGIPNALPVAPWTALPAGCTANGNAGGRNVIQSEKDWQAAFTCAAKTPSGIDFEMHDLVVAQRMLSPAQTGTDIYDDGQTITFVVRSRTTCPNEPHPMPVPDVRMFLIPARANRGWGEKSCTVETKCN